MRPKPARKMTQHEGVHHQLVVQRDHAEQPAARHGLDAVLAASELGLQAEEVDHLRQGQRDHREVDALPADRQQAGTDAQHRRAAGAEQDRQLGRQAPHLGRMRRGIAGGAEEHRVAEGQQPAEADQQVEGAGEEREAHHLHHEHRVDEGRCGHEEGHHHDEGDAVHAQFIAAPLCGGRRRRADRVRHFCAPNRPAGRTSSTMAMMMKMTVLDASG